jgi:hypothetical protein
MGSSMETAAPVSRMASDGYMDHWTPRMRSPQTPDIAERFRLKFAKYGLSALLAAENMDYVLHR